MARKLLRVDMDEEEIEVEKLPEAYKALGGRGDQKTGRRKTA
ncbi:MAG: hypothetical protein V5A77_08415 [Candidatus Bipolaricaulota bacterium]